MRNKAISLLFLLLGTLGVRGQQAWDPTALDELIRFNEEQKTARLLVAIGDTVVADRTFRGRADELYRLYSITKLFSGIAVGIMLEQGLIPHPEERLSAYFDSWKNDPVKSRITIRHVLQHTSGLYSSKGSKDIYPQTDFVRFALEDTVITEPGQVFFYNNRAINLVSGLVRKLTGSSLEDFLQKHLFQPLGIRDHIWPKDAAGNSWGMDGLRLSGGDLLKIAQLLADYGKWQGKQLMSRTWCEMMFQLPLVNSIHGTGGYGLGVRVLYINGRFRLSRAAITRLVDFGFDPALAGRIIPITDSTFGSWKKLGEALAAVCSAAELEQLTAASFTHMVPVFQEADNQVLVSHFGEIGQQIIVYPKNRLSMVRLLDERWGRKTNSEGKYAYEVNEQMFQYLLKLVPGTTAQK